MSFYNETYFEFDEAFEDPWTRVPNAILDDVRISAKAVGIYTKIVRFQNSKNHKIYISSITKQLKDGKDSIRSGIKELMDLGYISRKKIRNDKGNILGYKYTVYVKPTFDVDDVNDDKVDDESVENTSSQPSSENPTTGNPMTGNSSHKTKMFLEENVLKENMVVVDGADKEKQLIDIFKTYKIQVRLMPQMKKLLLTYIDKIELPLYEELFMLASEDNVKSKYKYIKEMLERWDSKNIYTLSAYENDCKVYKEAKNKNKNKTTGKIENKIPKVATRFHNINQRINDYTKEELEETVLVSQSIKFGDDNLRALYYKAMENGINSLFTEAGKNAVVKYAEKRKLEIPS